MKILDLYSGAGGAAVGYSNAGHTIIGVDITSQANYPHTFWRMDALVLLRKLIAGESFGLKGHDKVGLDDIDFIHASPPCQLYSAGNRANTNNRHPDLVDATRQLLMQTGKPWVIENVAGAPLHSPITLCGRMFGLGAFDIDGEWLQLDRHRLFEASFTLAAPFSCRPHDRSVQVGGVYGGARRDKIEARHERKGGYVPASLPVLQQLLGIDWMTEKELYLAIPPTYTEYIIRQYEKIAP